MCGVLTGMHTKLPKTLLPHSTEHTEGWAGELLCVPSTQPGSKLARTVRNGKEGGGEGAREGGREGSLTGASTRTPASVWPAVLT